MLETIKRIKVKIDEWVQSAQPYLLILFLIAFTACVVISTLWYSESFLPDPVSALGKKVTPLFTTTTIITVAAFFGTHILLFYFAFAYRNAPARKARYIKGNRKLEFFWILIPLVAFLFLFVWGQILWMKMTTPPTENALQLDVVGSQFSWRVRYPGDDNVLGRSNFRLISANNPMGIDFDDPNSEDDFVPVQMHIPKGMMVNLSLRSRDVIHSFFIPHLRVKMDAVPGMTTRLHFTATATTEEMRQRLQDKSFNYEVACAELCGRMHFAMKLILVVDEPEQYQQWTDSLKSRITMISR